MKASSKRIRHACFVRSGGFCECACGRFITEESAEWDHQRGRVREPESIRNTWVLHRECHARRTLNVPSSAHWWMRVEFHALAHGYEAEKEHAVTMQRTQALKFPKPGATTHER